jgi:hypothetical protein
LYLLIPLAVLALGIAAVILSLTGPSWLSGLFGGFVLSLPILFMVLFLSDIGFLEHAELKDITDLAGIGFYICLGAGAILAASKFTNKA